MTIAPVLAPHVEGARGLVCLHCRTALPASARDDFCCAGCLSVYTLLRDEGLDRYYTLRGERTLSPVASLSHGHVSPWLELLASELAAKQGVARVVLDVQGLQCGACVWLIEALFARAAHGIEVRVNPALGQLTCVVDARFDLRAFVGTVESFGYRLGPARKASSSEQSGLVLRTGICLALAANTMLLSAATYFGLEEGPLFTLICDASFAMATLSALIGGSYFVRRAWLGLRRGVFHLDLPIALGMGLAYLGSVLSHFTDEARGSYLDTVSVFIALMLVGRWLQERLIEKNRRALLASDGASGLLTRRLRDGRVALTPCATIAAGDTLLVCPGELVPVRARLDDDEARCALDWINGESEPRRFVRGDELIAGAVNAGDSALRVTALSAFERSDLDALVRDDGADRARGHGDFWDRLARLYVLFVLIATAIGALAWFVIGASTTAVLDVATAVLVVTCPCAFGIATPLAYELGVAGLRRAGLFVRDATFFDRAARVRKIVFDKTGTLTTGALVLADPACLFALTRAERGVLYDLTAQSNHPKSAAIARALAAHDATLQLSGASAQEVAGRGVTCVRDGVVYRLGEPSWALHPSESGPGPVFSADGALRATLVATEVTRPDATEEVAALGREGFTLYIASGDTADRVAAMATRLGIPSERAFSDLTPDGKRDLIAALDRSDTLMLGDGINDGPALSRAHCAGTPAIDRPFVPARTDFYFQTPGLMPVRLSLQLARAVRRVVKRALVFATLYNVLAVGLSYAGLMRPWLAAVLMPASSLLVLAYTVQALSRRRSLWKS